MRTTWKSKLWNALIQRSELRVVVVNSINSNAKEDNDDNNGGTKTQHFKAFQNIWGLIESMAFVVGVSAFREVDINARMVFTASVIGISFCSIFYTMFVVWPSIPLFLEVVCIFGVLIPGTLKFRLILKDVKHIFPINKFFENILTDHPIGRRSDDLTKEMTDAYNKVKIFVGASLVCFAVFILYPMKAYITEDRLIPIMRIEFPFLDQTDTQGYIIGQIILLLIGCLGLIGSVAFDLVVLAILLGFKSLVTLMIHDLDDYHDISKKGDTYSIHYQDSYLRCFKRTFGTITFHSIFALYASLICAVYAALNNGWISGYGFCLFGFIQLYVQCILGTFVDIQNERMSQAFYMTPWHEYPVRVQKIFSLLIHASTFNAIKLRIGPYARLNVKTALMITKSIFSYYTAISSLT